jgi:gluconokinase
MIVVVGGVAGSGKTTVGRLLAERLGWIFADGDSFHPAANLAKMAAGSPLTDADRWPWLRAICAWMDERQAASESAVIACSALRRRYRDLLLTGRDQAKMAFLVIGEHADEDRLRRRAGHFFSERLISSQFAELELPASDEPMVTVVRSAGSVSQTTDEVIRLLGLSSSS